MRRWKRGCRSKIQMRDESGVTLVELLAALSLLSVVILLGGSIYWFGQRHFMSQTESAEQANDLSYALNVISADLRKQSMNNVEIKENQIYIKKDGEEAFSSEPTYYVDDARNQLMKDGGVIADSVSEMTAEFDGTNIGVEITLISSSQHSSQKEYSTKVTFRRLPEN